MKITEVCEPGFIIEEHFIETEEGNFPTLVIKIGNFETQLVNEPEYEETNKRIIELLYENRNRSY